MRGSEGETVHHPICHQVHLPAALKVISDFTNFKKKVGKPIKRICKLTNFPPDKILGNSISIYPSGNPSKLVHEEILW